MNEAEFPVITSNFKSVKSIILNRPQHINSLNIEMIKMITDHFMEVMTEDKCLYILFQGRGNKGFCAGGDVKNIAQNVKDNDLKDAMLFFEREYALDLMIHKSSKPVIVVADGITMGGGLGIAAGADIVIVTERTVMAMPETKIGFFPDIGSTGWLFQKCRRGYPEYLALTGYAMKGMECVRLGLATHYIESKNITAVIDVPKTILMNNNSIKNVY
jgi:enoyl-CoA hydratase/carnithine racemase